MVTTPVGKVVTILPPTALLKPVLTAAEELRLALSVAWAPIVTAASALMVRSAAVPAALICAWAPAVNAPMKVIVAGVGDAMVTVS